MSERIFPDLCITLRPYERVTVTPTEIVWHQVGEGFTAEAVVLRGRMEMRQVNVVNRKGVKKLELTSD